MGYDDVSCYGRPDLSTPNIDRVAANGVRFLQAYANSAVCSSTRTALITGRYQYRLRLGLEEPLAPGAPNVGLPPEHPTLPSLLKKAGYGTTLIGKWHLGALPKFGPLKGGSDHFYGFRGAAIDYYAHTNIGGQEDFWDEEVPLHKVGYSTDLLGSRAVDAINDYAKAGQPFLVSLHFNAPHFPWEAPGDEAESAQLRGTNLTDFDGGSQETYRRMIAALDLQIGRVMEALDANNIAGYTIVVFTSDNGGERFSDTWPFTGRKTELLEGGLRIPALISWPGHIPAGRTTDQVAISMDWMPTLLAAAGTAPDPAFPPDGMNLLPGLMQNAAPMPRKLFWRYKANWQRAVRDGDYKYLKILDNTFLFNVVADPMERANLDGAPTGRTGATMRYLILLALACRCRIMGPNRPVGRKATPRQAGGCPSLCWPHPARSPRGGALTTAPRPRDRGRVRHRARSRATCPYSYGGSGPSF